MRQDTDPLPPSFRESLGSDNPLVDYFLSTLFFLRLSTFDSDYFRLTLWLFSWTLSLFSLAPFLFFWTFRLKFVSSMKLTFSHPPWEVTSQ